MFSVSYFGAQGTPLQNDSVLPINQIFLTQSRLGTLDFHEKEILEIIRLLNTHKQICDRTLIKLLIILFQSSIKYLYYPDIQKRSKTIPVHKIVINN